MNQGVLATQTLRHRNANSFHALRHVRRPVPFMAHKRDSMTSEASLAWALADAVSVCFTWLDHVGIYIALGAGETCSAIEQILGIAVRKRYPLPATLISTLAVWLDGYICNEHEPTIRRLLNQIESQALRTTAPPRRGTDTNPPPHCASSTDTKPPGANPPTPTKRPSTHSWPRQPESSISSLGRTVMNHTTFREHVAKYTR